MGFFSKLWKGVKNVFSGIAKVFSPILAPLALILDKKWAKALLLAVSAFTFGSALMAGGKAFTAFGAENAGASFMDKFVAGGKEFVSSLLGQGGEQGAKGLAEGGSAGVGEAALVQGSQTSGLNPMALNEGMAAENINAAGNMVNPDLSGSGNLLTKAAEAGGTGPSTALANAGGQLATRKPPGSGNWLAKAAQKAWDFAKSDDGQNIIGSALKGQFEGARDESWQKHQSRYDRMWQNPNDPGNVALSNQDYYAPPPVWQGNIENRDYTPSVPYTRGGG